MSNFGMKKGFRYYCKDCGSDKIIFRAEVTQDNEIFYRYGDDFDDYTCLECNDHKEIILRKA